MSTAYILSKSHNGDCPFCARNSVACMTITEGDGNAEVIAQSVANIRSNIELQSGVATAIGVIGGETYLTTNPYLSIHSSSYCKGSKR